MVIDCKQRYAIPDDVEPPAERVPEGLLHDFVRGRCRRCQSQIAWSRSVADMVSFSAGDKQHVGCGHAELAVHPIRWSHRTFLQRRTPCQPFRRIRRSAVDLATGMPSRCKLAHILSDPYSDSNLRRPCSSGS